MALLITITNAGRAEIINAQNTGTGPVTITEIGFGTGQYTPSKLQTTLQAQVKRMGSIAGLVVADDTIHVMAKDESADAYNVGEFGLFSATGTLVAVYSQLPTAGWIIQKASPSTLMLATDIILESLDATHLTFGDIFFVNPPGTTEVPGVLELATPEETQLGEDSARAIHPAGLKSLTATLLRAGLVQLVNSLTSNSQTMALTAAQGKKLQDEKQPLDATLTALASVVTAANQMIYSTGADAFATTALTAFTRTLLDDVDAAAARTTLGAAPLNSPALTGLPTAPTAAVGTNTTQIATMAAIQAAIGALVNSAPGALDQLNELAAALGNDPNFATTMINALATKQPLDATLTALAGLASAANQMIYSTGADAFAMTALSAFARTLLDDADAAAARTTLGAAPLNSPGFTGLPTAPTAAAGTSTTQLASTEFVQIAVGTGIGEVSGFAQSTPPSGWLKANGAAVSRTAYAALFAAIGTTWGAGDGSTTFNLPDARGEFMRGWDDGRGIDTGRVFGSSQSDQLRAHTHSGVVVPGSASGYGTATQNVSDDDPFKSGTSGSSGGTETRPRNIALLFCIKY